MERFAIRLSRSSAVQKRRFSEHHGRLANSGRTNLSYSSTTVLMGPVDGSALPRPFEPSLQSIDLLWFGRPSLGTMNYACCRSRNFREQWASLLATASATGLAGIASTYWATQYARLSCEPSWRHSPGDEHSLNSDVASV